MAAVGASSDFRWMAAPAVIFAAGMIAFPLGYAVWLSLSELALGSDPRLIGFANFARLGADPEFWNGGLAIIDQQLTAAEATATAAGRI